MYEHFQDNLPIPPQPQPCHISLDDDAPLPQRYLARLSNASTGSEGSGNTMTIPGSAQGMLNSQLQRLQLSEIVNMLLPDSGYLPRKDAIPGTPSEGDPEPSHPCFHDVRGTFSHSAGIDFSAGIESVPTKSSIDFYSAHSMSPGGTPHSEPGSSGRCQHAADEILGGMPSLHKDASGDSRHKWGRGSGKAHSGVIQDAWATPLHKSMAYRSRMSSPPHRPRSLSLGDDVLSRYASPATTVPEAAEYASSAMFMSASIEMQQEQ
jgi:hypothetical protein